jgi:hypothetical protein
MKRTIVFMFPKPLRSRFLNSQKTCQADVSEGKPYRKKLDHSTILSPSTPHLNLYHQHVMSFECRPSLFLQFLSSFLCLIFLNTHSSESFSSPTSSRFSRAALARAALASIHMYFSARQVFRFGFAS